MSRLASYSYWVAILWLTTLVLLSSTANFLPLPKPLDLDLGKMLQGPTSADMAGTDELGRDVLSRVVYAARSTLLITAGATSLALFLGVILGGAAGYLGGWPDRLVLLLTDLFWSIPFVIFVVLIVAVTGVSKTSLILTIGGINWVSPARVIRAETSRLANVDFVIAARSHGYSESHVLVYEILPNLWKTIFTLAAYGAIEVMTLETGLAFLGLSMPAPSPTWGGMLADGLSYFSSAWWIVLVTAGVITATLGSLQLLARGLEKAS